MKHTDRRAHFGPIRLALGLAVLFLLVPVSKPYAQPPFIRDNLSSFSTRSLSNGIPLYVKRSSANRVLSLSLVIRGGSLSSTPDQAGLAKTALAAMSRSSGSYSYPLVAELLDSTSSSIAASSQFEYSSLGLTVLDKYFSRLLPVWTDMIVSPSFSPSDVEQAKSETILAIQSKEQDPWALAGKIMNAAFFASHPYSINPEGTEATVSKFSADSLRSWYAESVSEDRVFVVAVGNFDPDSLAAELDPGIGSLPRKELPAHASASSFLGKSSGGLILEPHEASRSLAYLRGDFPAPSPDSPDYMPLNLAMKLVSDLLFSVVRDKYGAVYSPGALIRAFGANYGSISIYKTSKPEGIKSYIDEALALMASGYCVSIDPSRPGGESAYMRIEDALETYKRIYTNEYFAAVRSNAAVAALMIRSVLVAGDPTYWLQDISRIASTTPDQVRSAFSAYILHGPFTWVAVGDPKLLDRLDPADFLGFSAGFRTQNID